MPTLTVQFGGQGVPADRIFYADDAHKIQIAYSADQLLPYAQFSFARYKTALGLSELVLNVNKSLATPHPSGRGCNVSFLITAFFASEWTVGKLVIDQKCLGAILAFQGEDSVELKRCES